MQYCDKVKCKLTLVKNKIFMIYDIEKTMLLNPKVRKDALHVFSGLFDYTYSFTRDWSQGNRAENPDSDFRKGQNRTLVSP